MNTVKSRVIVDFHTHIFPDKLAPRALAALLAGCDSIYTPATNGTLSGLIEYMDKNGIDISVTMPVLTKQSQTVTSNEWAASTASERIVPFGGLYPHTDDYKRDIDFIASLGLIGIKLHPEYQNFVVDSPEMMKIYDYALSRGLMLMFHAGFDPAFPPPIKSSPQQFAHIVDEMQGGTIIAAHFGGQEQWDDVEKYLAGKNIYIDTSMGFEFYTKEQFLRIKEKHGANKILFGTDSPWSYADKEIAKLSAMPIPEEEKDMIFAQNALKLIER